MLKRLWRDHARSRAIRRLNALDATAEPGFERYVEQAANAYAAPMALLTLVDDDQLWIRATQGLALGCVPREHSFCTHGVDAGDLLEVCDAATDPRFRDLPAVIGEPYVRYYIGARLTVAGETGIGMLCVADTRPRPPASPDQRAYLRGLARQASGAIERHSHVLQGHAA